MTPERCPSCAAAVPAGAAWCSLCFASLAPAPEDEPKPQPELEPEREPQGEALSEVVPEPVQEPLPERVPESQLLPAAALVTVGAGAVGPPAAPEAGTDPAPAQWPCLLCGDTAPLDAMECPTCGAGFLAGADAASTLRLPGVGDAGTLTTMQKFGVAAVGSLMMAVICFVVLFVFSAVF